MTHRESKYGDVSKIGYAYGHNWAIWGANKPYYKIRRQWREHLKRKARRNE